MVQDTPVTDRDFAALFREEAGSILTEQQINDEIEREQTRSAQAARAEIALLSVSPFKRSDRSCQCTASYLLSFVGGTQTDRLSSGRGLLCLRYCLCLFLRHFVYLPPQTSHTA